MSRTESITCDFCGKVKGQTNHWHAIRIYQRDLIVSKAPQPNPEWKDACGEQCVGKGVSRFLDHGTLEEYR